MQKNQARSLGIKHEYIVRLVVLGVATNAFIIILGTLVDELVMRRELRLNDIATGIPLFVGMTLLYLSYLLSRRKRAAWTVSIIIYGLLLAINLGVYMARYSADIDGFTITLFIRNILLPLVVSLGLITTHEEFQVKSDVRSFGSSLRFTFLALLIALVYGVTGLKLLEERDFHQDFSIPTAIHYTVDQFGLTTSKQLAPYTKRARVFLDSLSVLSAGALGFSLLSLFQPLRARFVNQLHNREYIQSLLERYPASSEDFFKLWPHDKAYFFHASGRAGLAFHIRRGVALVVGDPVGDHALFDDLLSEFDELCYVNDWSPAYIHTEPEFSQLYKNHDFELQKLGEEAILDIKHFQDSVLNNKYFRNIKNRFEREAYTAEVLKPPHAPDVIVRLQQISNEWLQGPGRAERGLMMGYFSAEYMQLCHLLVARDQNGVIQGFINQIPSFDNEEANFDLLRHTRESLSNINDFILINFINHVASEGFIRLNLGLCPLTGLDKNEENKSVIDSALRFAYANGDRFYSFSGLHRFKAKYEPQWSSRYVAFRGGIGGFTKAFNSLNGAWKVKHLRRR